MEEEEEEEEEEGGEGGFYTPLVTRLQSWLFPNNARHRCCPGRKFVCP